MPELRRIRLLGSVWERGFYGFDNLTVSLSLLAASSGAGREQITALVQTTRRTTPTYPDRRPA